MYIIYEGKECNKLHLCGMHYSPPFLIATIVTVAFGARFPTANFDKREVTYGNNPKSIIYYHFHDVSMHLNYSRILVRAFSSFLGWECG